MKRLVKYCFMAALGLLVPGIVLCVLGTVAGGVWREAFSNNNLISDAKPLWGWNWSHGSGELEVKKVPPVQSGSGSWQIPREEDRVKRLDFAVEAGSLELTAGDGFSLETPGCEGLQVESTLESGTWKLKVCHDDLIGHLAGHDAQEEAVEVVLPRDLWYDAVELECEAGGIEGEELACGRLVVDTEAGGVQLRRIQADSMDLSADAGSVDVSGTVNDKATLEANAGSVTLRTPKPEQYGYALECSMGQAELFGEFSSALYNREMKNEDLRPFFNLKATTGKAVVRADDTL